MLDFYKIKRFSLLLLIVLAWSFVWFQLVALWTTRDLIELKERKDYSIDSLERVINVQDRHIANLIFKIENYQLKNVD